MNKKFLQRQWEQVRQGVEGVALPKEIPTGLQKLLQSGMSADEIARAIAAGKINVGSGTAKVPADFTLPVPGPLSYKFGERATGRPYSVLEYSQDELAAWQKSQESGATIAGNKQPPSEDAIKKAQKLQDLVNKLKYSERELVEIEAQKLIQKEKLSPKLVEEWKTLQLQKIEMEDQEKLGKARTDAYEAGQKAESEASQARLEFQKQVLTIDDELAKRRESLAVDKGELSAAQAAQMELERKKAILEVEKQILQVRMAHAGEFDPKAVELSNEYMAIQEKINRLPEEGQVTTETTTRAQQKKAYEVMKYFAADYHLFRQKQIEELSREMIEGGQDEVAVKRWATEELRKSDIEEYQFKLEYADNLARALEAKYRVMTLQAKTAAQLMADAFENAFGDIKASMSDMLMDSKNGFRNWESIVTNTLDRVMKRFLDAQIEAAMGPTKGGGNNLFSWIASLFGSGGGNTGWSVADQAATEAAWGYHKGGTGREPTFLRVVPAAVFDMAERYHTGIGPNERPAIITNDETVFTQGQMRALGLLTSRAGQAPQVNVTITPPKDTETRAEQSTRGDGTIDLKLLIEEVAGNSIASGRGKINKSLQQIYGLRPSVGRR
jgi:hypothetical protein